MNMKAAKEVVKQAFNEWSGFEAVLPADILFCCAGNVVHNGWGKAKLYEFFKSSFSNTVIK
jgi:hypothetical protein